MDERKKQIEELEQKRRDNLAALDSCMERLGETLLGRVGEESPVSADSPPAAGEYHRLRKEIAGSEDSIKTIEEQIRRQRELEERIALKEQEEGERAKGLSGLYARLGKAALEAVSAGYGEGLGGAAAPYREQAEDLTSKVRSLEDRLAELERKDGSNVFSWIGKSAQGLVLRSFLTKAQDNLDQLYRNAGERFSRPDLPDLSALPEAAGIIAAIAQAREASRSLSADLAALREEFRRIGGSIGAEGGPLKQIQGLRNHISRTREELRVLYRRFGGEAAAAGKSAETGEGRLFASLITAEDQPVLDEADRLRSSIRDTERSMEKLRASLAIDGEQAKIEKCRRAIADKQARIAEAEKDIAEFEDSIQDSEKYIEELRKLL